MISSLIFKINLGKEDSNMTILNKHTAEETVERMEVKIEHFNPEACDCYCCTGDYSFRMIFSNEWGRRLSGDFVS